MLNYAGFSRNRSLHKIVFILTLKKSTNLICIRYTNLSQLLLPTRIKSESSYVGANACVDCQFRTHEIAFCEHMHMRN